MEPEILDAGLATWAFAICPPATVQAAAPVNMVATRIVLADRLPGLRIIDCVLSVISTAPLAYSVPRSAHIPQVRDGAAPMGAVARPGRGLAPPVAHSSPIGFVDDPRAMRPNGPA